MVFLATPTEVLALILIIISGIKIITILVNPNAWLENVVKKVYSNQTYSQIVFLVLSLIVLYFLLKELTIVQILAVLLFAALIFAIGFSAYSKELINLADRLYRQKNIFRRCWLSFLIWIILLLWGLKELFFWISLFLN